MIVLGILFDMTWVGLVNSVDILFCFYCDLFVL